MKINYAVQTYDIASNSCFDRYCTNDKKELVQKCISSFFRSIDYAAKQSPDQYHNIRIFDNGSTEDTIDFLNRIIEQNDNENVSIVLDRINSGSMINSIRTCFNWLKESEGDIVYLVQDDYLYTKTAIHEMVDIYLEILTKRRHQCIIYPFNTPDNWKSLYRYSSTPRMVELGCFQYWIQCFDISCAFMTGREQLIHRWSTIEFFMSIDQVKGVDGKLESISLNRILVDDGVLGLMPFESVGLHMQGEREREPYIDWKQRWNDIVNY
jgi:glycosyltransferase involved in cell wall biosynthesis